MNATALQQPTLADNLRAEAAIEPDPVSTSLPVKQTLIIAIYGKGGIGKSFALANLSYMMAQQGKKVLSSVAIRKATPPRCCSAAAPARPSSKHRPRRNSPVKK